MPDTTTPETNESFAARVQAEMQGKSWTPKNVWAAVMSTAAAQQTEVSTQVQTALDKLLLKGGVITEDDKQDVLAALQAAKKKDAVKRVQVTAFVFVTGAALTLTGVLLYQHFKKK